MRTRGETRKPWSGPVTCKIRIGQNMNWIGRRRTKISECGTDLELGSNSYSENLEKFTKIFTKNLTNNGSLTQK